MFSDHDEMNGDTSITHATLGDTTYLSDLTNQSNHIGSGDVTTSSLSPISPELHTGAFTGTTNNPFDLSSKLNPFETSKNASVIIEKVDDLEKTTAFEQNNGFSNDFTGTNQEVLHETLLSGSETEESRFSQPGETASHMTLEQSDHESNPLDDAFEDQKKSEDTLDKGDSVDLLSMRVARLCIISPVINPLDVSSSSSSFSFDSVPNSTATETRRVDLSGYDFDDGEDIYTMKTISRSSSECTF